MPLYEYHCAECESDCELLVRSSDTPECPQCGGKKLKKLLSVPAAHVAGNSSAETCRPMPSGGCGLPQCGTGACGFE